MTFFPEINQEKTKANAKRKLGEYLRWSLIAGDVKEQKITATYSFEPRQPYGTPSKPVEKLAVNYVSAVQEIEAIRSAINRLLKPIYRKILIEKYMYDKKDWEIYTQLGYEKSQYYHLRDSALIAFAHSYRNGVLVVENGKRPE